MKNLVILCIGAILLLKRKMEAKINRAIPNVEKFMRNRHIFVPNDWLHDCIQFIYEEDGPQLTSRGNWGKDLPQQVYEQWLSTNLNDLSTPCLPSDLANNKKVAFEGHFALQINSLLDISQPAFQQLTKLDGVDRSNAEVTAENISQPKHTRAQRMLKLEITDGVQSIAGIEYETIPFLDVSLPPGVKVLLFGMLECCRGVLLLTRGNISVLGGEVDELSSRNGQLQLLSNILRCAPPAEANQNVEIPEDPDVPRRNSNNPVVLEADDWEDIDDFEDRGFGRRQTATAPLTEINTNSVNARPRSQNVGAHVPVFDLMDIVFEDEDENAFQ